MRRPGPMEERRGRPDPDLAFRRSDGAVTGRGRRTLLVAAAVVALAAGLGGAVLLAAGGGEDPPARGADAAVLARGRELYAQHCASCHGAALEGQPNWRQRRPDGRLPAPPHDASGHTWHHPDAQLFELTKRGPTALVPGYASDMPGFGEVLGDGEIRAVLRFIKSTWPAEIRARQEALGAARGRPP